MSMSERAHDSLFERTAHDCVSERTTHDYVREQHTTVTEQHTTVTEQHMTMQENSRQQTENMCMTMSVRDRTADKQHAGKWQINRSKFCMQCKKSWL